MVKGSAAAVLLVAALTRWSPALADPPQPPLPKPYATPSVSNSSDVIGWPEGGAPKANGPFKVTLWAELERARKFLELPNGDVLVAQYTANRISLLRRDGAGRPKIFPFLTSGPNAPFGMALVGQDLYVAATDALWRYRYEDGATSIDPSSGTKLLDLPVGGHSTRDLLASPDGKKLYVSVGSGSNVDESGDDAKDPRRAAITEYDVATGGTRILAGGLRNPNGLVWNPVTGALWVGVNERDGLGDDLVPDYVTSVKPGGFYGWPYFYFGDNEDPRKAGERPELAKTTLVPDLAVGAHTASLGLAFYAGGAFPERYRGGLFVAQHGSWNRSKPAGYRVAFVPFDANGHVAGPAQPFLTGFLSDKDPITAYGRPVGVAMLRDGSLLVADDAGDRVWRVTRDGPDDGAPALGGLMLVDADKDAPVFPLEDGMRLDRARLDVAAFNVIAAASGPVGSVRFKLDGRTERTANAPPFTIAPFATSVGKLDYAALKLKKGRHTLVATPFSEKDAKGRKGEQVRVEFKVE